MGVGVGVGEWVVGKSDFKENPKSDQDLDLWFVKIRISRCLGSSAYCTISNYGIQFSGGIRYLGQGILLSWDCFNMHIKKIMLEYNTLIFLNFFYRFNYTSDILLE